MLTSDQLILHARAKQYIRHHLWYFNPFPMDAEVGILYETAWSDATDDTEVVAPRTGAVNSQASIFQISRDDIPSHIH